MFELDLAEDEDVLVPFQHLVPFAQHVMSVFTHNMQCCYGYHT